MPKRSPGIPTCHPHLGLCARGLCHTCYQKKYYNEAKHKATRARLYNKMYGITTEQYQETLTKQNGKCAICERNLDKPCRDHCHITGKFRGLLCLTCNTALGAFKDNPKLLERAISYINETTIRSKDNTQRLDTSTLVGCP